MVNYRAGIAYLASQGLNLAAIFDCSALPAAVTATLQDARIAVEKYRRLLLLAHGGRQLWQMVTTTADRSSDPIDDFSRQRVQYVIDHYLQSPAHIWLYPGDLLLPLQQLGAAVGWQQTSPLGLGIHPHYGLWFAYRAALLVDAELPVTEFAQASHSVCEQCGEKPCITTCPAAAVSENQAFALTACADYRLSESSPCADRCLARLACPVGEQYRYSDEQLQYHYQRSLASLQAYYGKCYGKRGE